VQGLATHHCDRLETSGFLRSKFFERAPEFKEIGAGIGLSANAIRVLKQLGLMQSIIDRGTVIESCCFLQFTRRSDRTRAHESFGRAKYLLASR